MAKNIAYKFIGKVEFLPSQGESTFHYCTLNISSGKPSGGMGGCINLESLGEIIAMSYGIDFRNNITYERPKGINYTGTDRGLCPTKYHALSDPEKEIFENSVLDALKNKK